MTIIGKDDFGQKLVEGYGTPIVFHKSYRSNSAAKTERKKNKITIKIKNFGSKLF
jgi:hypothetical protein